MGAIRIPMPVDHKLTEKSSDRIYYAYDGDSMSYSTVLADGSVLTVDFLTNNYPSLGISVSGSVAEWYSGLSESFFGLSHQSVVDELLESASRHGIEPPAFLAELAAGGAEE